MVDTGSEASEVVDMGSEASSEVTTSVGGALVALDSSSVESAAAVVVVGSHKTC